MPSMDNATKMTIKLYLQHLDQDYITNFLNIKFLKIFYKSIDLNFYISTFLHVYQSTG